MAFSAPASVVFALWAALSTAAQDPAAAFQSLSKQADAARDAHQLPKAIDLYKRALKLKPAWEEGWWNLGSVAYDLDQYDECAAAFRRLSVLKPDGAPGWTMLGLCEFNLHHYGPTVEALTHVEEMGFREKINSTGLGAILSTTHSALKPNVSSMNSSGIWLTAPGLPCRAAAASSADWRSGIRMSVRSTSSECPSITRLTRSAADRPSRS